MRDRQTNNREPNDPIIKSSPALDSGFVLANHSIKNLCLFRNDLLTYYHIEEDKHL
jgi:hypothetical protein